MNDRKIEPGIVQGGDMKKIEWDNFIHSDPSVLLGKPVVKGTRLSVEFILGLYAQGWTEDQILENHPNLRNAIGTSSGSKMGGLTDV